MPRKPSPVIETLSYDPRLASVLSAINSDLTESELRKLYSQARSIYQKRLKRLKAAYPESPQVQGYKDLPLTTSLDSRQSVAQKLMLARNYLLSPSRSIVGRKETLRKTLETFALTGKDMLTEENIDNFGVFMEYWRALGLDGIFDSDRVIEYYQQYYEGRTSLEEYLVSTFGEYLGGFEAAAKAVVTHSKWRKERNVRDMPRRSN